MQITAQDLAQLATTRHIDYLRTIELYNDYRSWVTGDGLDKQLEQIIKRESEEEFKQRVRLTAHIIPTAVSKARSVFNKGLRSNAISLYYSHNDTTKTEYLKNNLAEFYGMQSERQYLDQYITDSTFIDPNGWLIVETNGTDGTQYAKTYPFVVNAPDALNFQYTNGMLDWLLIQTNITYQTTDSAKAGVRYTLYGTDRAIIAEQLSNDSILKRMPRRNTLYEFDGVFYFQQNDTALFVIIEPEPYELTPPVAMRWGYIPDAMTGHRTYVSPLESARPYFKKSLKAVSEFDLATTMHAFPQRVQYAPKCQAPGCVNGLDQSTGAKCSVCDGKGFMSAHTSAQDVITLTMPRDVNEAFDLNNLVQYITLPIDVLQFQDAQVDKLVVEMQKSIFNSDVFTRSEVATTATEKTIELQAVYDTLYPFAKHYSELWQYIVSQTAEYMSIMDGLNIVAIVKQDFKLKTYDEILEDLTKAKTAGASMAIIEGLDADAANVLYKDTPDLVRKYAVMSYFDPFGGKTEQEKISISSTLPIDNDSRVLYMFFKPIFTDIEIDKGADVFYNMAPAMQKKIINEYVIKYKATLVTTPPNVNWAADASDNGTNNDDMNNDE